MEYDYDIVIIGAGMLSPFCECEQKVTHEVWPANEADYLSEIIRGTLKREIPEFSPTRYGR